MIEWIGCSRSLECAILKERLFGLTNSEGNHGKDVKELYYYLDATPSHSWMQMLHKYPQTAFPYAQLVEENRRRSTDDPEFELLDTGVFDDDRYFDVAVTYAKAAPDDILMEFIATNRASEAAARLRHASWQVRQRRAGRQRQHAAPDGTACGRIASIAAA
jgi:hypothetical protein